MTDFELKNMQGRIFRNPKKEEGDQRPNATGFANIDGRKIRISSWTKEGKNGKFQSLSLTWDDEIPQRPKKEQAEDPFADIPFA